MMITRSFSPLLSGLALAAVLGGLGGCLTNTPDPDAAGIYACADSSECPGTQSCLQGVCEAITLPVVKIQNPEDGDAFPFGEEHQLFILINATDFILRPRAESSEAVPGEGHLVVFIDEVETGVIDTGDLGAGVQFEASIPDTPGAHRIRVQARLNDGTNYDNEEASPRNIVWIDDGGEHVAFRKPWPGEVFSLESQLVDAEIASFGGIEISRPEDGLEHVHVYYDEDFPDCLEEPACEQRYSGVVPSDDDSFGPVIFPESGAVTVKLQALVRNSDHTRYLDDNEEPVLTEIEILRSNAQ